MRRSVAAGPGEGKHSNMAMVHGTHAPRVAEAPCSSSRASCSYPVTQVRSAVGKRSRAQRASKLACRCSASTPAQLDSARLQKNGVGKAQAGTTCSSILHSIALLCSSSTYNWCLLQPPPDTHDVQLTQLKSRHQCSAADVSKGKPRRPKLTSLSA